MKANRPRLYGLILEHMRVESKDEAAQEENYLEWSEHTDSEKMWQAIIKIHTVEYASNMEKVKELMARKTCQNIKQCTYDWLAHNNERFRDTCRVCKESILKTRIKQWFSAKV